MTVAPCFDTERCACPQPFAFTIPFGQRTCKTPSAYAYTSFVSKLVLAKPGTISKHLGKLLLFARLLTGCILCDEIWVGPGDEARKFRC